MIDRNVMSQTSTASGTLKNGSDVPVVVDGFTAVKRTGQRLRKKPLAPHHSLLRKIKNL
jgi:hypothetical protein